MSWRDLSAGSMLKSIAAEPPAVFPVYRYFRKERE
jgi:hypothetical protein